MKRSMRLGISVLLPLLVAACVTINVYFPAAAAEKAADRIIRDVYGDTPAEQKAPEPQTGLDPLTVSQTVAIRVLNWVIAPAQAAADISVETAAIKAIEASMKNRHAALANFYKSKVVGMTDDGLIAVIDLAAVPLKDRRHVNQLVADENRDRNALYAEIARANGHPEWEAEIRDTFSRRWVANAPAGWQYQQGGVWKTK